MKRILIFCLVILLLPFLSVAQTEGEKLFSTICIACHTIGGGRLVGPDLKDVDKKQSDKWIKAFIKSSQDVIKSGDKTATALFAEYGSIVMPDQPTFTDAQISSIITYIKSKGTPKEDVAADKDSKSKKDTAMVATATAATPSAPASASSSAPSSNVQAAAASTEDGPSLFSNQTFWIVAGLFVVMLFVIYALSKTVISLSSIANNAKN